MHTSRGLAIGDVNNDGRLDMIVVNRDGPAYLLMNQADAGAWIRFSVLSRDGRDAHGAVVAGTIQRQGRTARIRRPVQPSSSYLASHDPRVHFGLADSDAIAEVTVRWIDGSEETFGDFAAGQTIVLRQGSTARE